jgi:hypothetical protein
MQTTRRRNSLTSVCASLIFSLLASCTCLHAQNSRGTILGHITDSSGGALVGAKVTVHNLNTGISSSFKTNSAGDAAFPH